MTFRAAVAAILVALAHPAEAQAPVIDCVTIKEITQALKTDLPYYRAFQNQSSAYFSGNLRRYERQHGLPDGEATTQLVSDPNKCWYDLREGGRGVKIAQYLCTGVALVGETATDLEAFGQAMTKRFFACPSEKTGAHLDRERETRVDAEGETVHVQSFWLSGPDSAPGVNRSAFYVSATALEVERDGRVIPFVSWSIGWGNWDQ
jgi:hypothetical protein